MYLFTIQATDAFGGKKKVQLRAAAPQEALRMLQQEGLRAELKDILEASRDSWWARLATFDFSRLLNQVPKKEVLRLINMVGHSLSRGRPLKTSLEFIGENEDHQGLKRLIEKLQQRMAQPFASQVEIFASCPQHFDEEFLGIIEAGETSSNLGRYLSDYVQEKKKQMAMAHSFRSILMKRLTTLAMVIGVAMVVVAFVIPQFKSLFGEKLQIPWAMGVLLSLSEFIRAFGVWIGLLLAAGLTGFYYALARSERFRFWWHNALLHLPVLGKTLRTYYTAQFAYLLSTLLTKNVDILKAMNIIIRQAGNVCIQETCRSLIRRMQGGDDLFSAIVKENEAGKDYLIPSIVQAAKVGGATASLGDTLMEVRNDLDELFALRLERAIRVFSAVFYGFIVACAVFIAYGIGSAIMAFYENAQELI